MAVVFDRLRTLVSSLGNDGAVANALAEIGRTAAARAAVDQLELRMALAQEAAPPRAA